MDVLLLLVTVVLLVIGFPVAFALGGAALAFAAFATWSGQGSLLELLPARIFGSVMTNETLVAIPLFVLMGMALERGRVAETAFEGLTKLLGDAPRGLVIAVLLVGTLLAASTGIVGATVTTLGLIALPALLQRQVPASLACGAVCAAGTLGQIIPPSIALVILGDQISNAFAGAQTTLQQAAWTSGDAFTPRSVSVGDLFAGALLPGLLLAGIYVLYALLRPLPRATSPAKPSTMTRAQAWQALLAPLVLIFAVLGALLSGIAPPSEAAAVGAAGALLLAAIRVPIVQEQTALPRLGAWMAGGVIGLLASAWVLGPSAHPGLPLVGAMIGALLLGAGLVRRQIGTALASISANGILVSGLTGALALIFGKLDATFVAAPLALAGVVGLLAALHRLYRAETLAPMTQPPLGITALLFRLLIGAAAFGLVLRDLGGDETVRGLLETMPGGSNGAVVLVLAVMVLLGLFLDFVEITLIVVPIAAPILLSQPEIDPIWLGVMMALALQTSFMTPPLGYALFYLRGVAPDSVDTREIYRGVLPFVALQIGALAIVWFWRDLAIWLPVQIFGF